jgi:CDP-6-deoxy-D-xylo-4-hexulose-3-dehydrase
MQTTDTLRTDITMNQTLWLGLYPGLSREQLDYSVAKLEDFFGVSDF